MRWRRRVPPEPSPFDLEQACILVVDDVPANTEVLSELLSSAGFEAVVCANDPQEGLRLYGERRPDLVLLDFRMPGMNGAAFIEAARARYPDLQPPVLIVTAQLDRETRRLALQAGARDFVTKPFEFWELLARVRNLLELSLLARAHRQRADRLETVVEARTRDLEHAQQEIIRRLCAASEFRDDVTGRHVARIGALAGALARAAGQDEEFVAMIERAAPLHDIGKIAVPDRILLKPARLDEAEWEIMKTHAEAGARILDDSGIALLDMASEIAHSHHERWDGTGYPRGLGGPDIPLAGRIVAISDVLDALLSPRPYKAAWPLPAVIDYLAAQRGGQFDPALLDIALDRLDELLALRDGLLD
jgi:putative two-component system response regulator